jgi:hypothetical protein
MSVVYANLLKGNEFRLLRLDIWNHLNRHTNKFISIKKSSKRLHGMESKISYFLDCNFYGIFNNFIIQQKKSDNISVITERNYLLKTINPFFVAGGIRTQKTIFSLVLPGFPIFLFAIKIFPSYKILIPLKKVPSYN